LKSITIPVNNFDLILRKATEKRGLDKWDAGRAGFITTYSRNRWQTKYPNSMEYSSVMKDTGTK